MVTETDAAVLLTGPLRGAPEPAGTAGETFPRPTLE